MDANQDRDAPTCPKGIPEAKLFPNRIPAFPMTTPRLWQTGSGTLKRLDPPVTAAQIAGK